MNLTEYKRLWRKNHPESCKAARLKWEKSNPEKVKLLNRLNARKKRAKARQIVFNHYGWFCQRCRSSKQLELDHIFGGGNKQRRKLGNRNFYFWVIKNKFPKYLRTLCKPCNIKEEKHEVCK